MKEFSSYYYTKSQENPPKQYIDIGYFEPKMQTIYFPKHACGQEKDICLQETSSVCVQGLNNGVNYE